MKKVALTILIFLLCLGLCGCAPPPFRLHILANSDSAEDQAVKLKVRDAILELTEEGVLQCHNKEDAKAYMQAHLEEIVARADEVLQEENFPYRATAEIGRFDFPDKTYGDVTYPAGEYDALRIKLGAAEGQNWWCVMFPPLCLVNMEDTADSQEVEYDSVILEWLRGLFGGGNQG